MLNSQDADVSVIDATTFTLIKRVPTGKEPHHLYLAPDEKTLIVANATGNTLSFIDPTNGNVLRTVPDILDPYHLRFSPDMKWFVTAANRLNHVDIYRWLGAERAAAAAAGQAHRGAAHAQPPQHRQQEQRGLRLDAGQRRTAGHRPGDTDRALEDQHRPHARRPAPEQPTTAPCWWA